MCKWCVRLALYCGHHSEHVTCVECGYYVHCVAYIIYNWDALCGVHHLEHVNCVECADHVCSVWCTSIRMATWCMVYITRDT